MSILEIVTQLEQETGLTAIWVSEADICKSFAERGLPPPPFLAFTPYEVRDGIPGYWIPKAREIGPHKNDS